jgi:hypothetical protein
MLSEQYDRPVHAEPILDGTFGERVEPPLRELEALHLTSSVDSRNYSAQELLRDIALGVKPLSQIPADWNRYIEAARPFVAQVLQATHARSGNPPKEWTTLDIIYSPEPHFLFGMLVDRAEYLALLDVWRATEKRDTRTATETCADIFALARDRSQSTWVGTSGLAAMMAQSALPACSHAAEKASPEELDALARSLEAIKQGWYPTSKMITHSSVFEQVISFYEDLSESTRAQIPSLPPRVGSSSATSPSGVGGMRETLLSSAKRRAAANFWLDIAKALQLPPAEGEASMKYRMYLNRTLCFYSNSGCTSLSTNPDVFVYEYLQSLRERTVALDQFRAVVGLCRFRASNHRWPASWAESGLAELVDARSGLPMKLQVADGVARIIPQADPPRTDEDLSITLH